MIHDFRFASFFKHRERPRNKYPVNPIPSVYFLPIFSIMLVASGVTTASAKEHSSADVEQYLVATGSGRSMREAKQGALAELSQYFSTRIQSRIESKIKRVADMAGNEQVEKEIMQQVKVLSEVELPGVQILNRQFNKADNRYQVTVALDRLQAGAYWRKQLKRLDTEIIGELDNFKAQNSAFLKLKSLTTIYGYWIERELMANRLMVIGMDTTELYQYRVMEIIGMRPALLKQVRIFISCRGPQADWVLQQLTHGLTAKGWLIADTRARGTIIVSCSLTSQQVHRQNPDWKFVTVSLAASIKDMKADVILGQISEQRKSGHLSYEDAENKAIKWLAPVVAEQLVYIFEGVNNK